MDLSYFRKQSLCFQPLLGAIILVLSLSSVPLSAASDADSIPDPEQEGISITERLELLIERIKYEQARLKTMEAAFVQKKESQFLIEPEESTGYFWYHAPDRVRWDFSEPDATTVLISGNEMLTWFKDLGTAEKVNVGKQADRVMEYLSAGNSLKTLQRYFEIRTTFPGDPEAPFKLELRPKFKRVEKRIKGMTIHLHRTGYYPVFLKYLEPDGDITELSFDDVVVNEAIEDPQFQVDLPETVQVKTVELGKKGKTTDSP